MCHRDDCGRVLAPALRKGGVRLLLTFAMP
jgi:hypothetical protein